MSNNKNTKKEPQQNEAPVDELDQLRQIVFGVAEQQLKKQIALTRSDLEHALNTQSINFTQRLDKMQENINQRFSDIERQIQHLDKTHDDNELVIQKDLANLASEHEMFATSTQQDFKTMEQSLDSGSQTLTHNFNEQLEQLKTHLESVSKELSSSKTDRKTLAKLLATMATNLEDDEL